MRMVKMMIMMLMNLCIHGVISYFDGDEENSNFNNDNDDKDRTAILVIVTVI